MSASSNDPSKYWRGGIAISIARKKIMDERLAELGMKTIGDLATFFIAAEGVIEALKPVVEKHRAATTPEERQKAALKTLKTLPPEELERLMALAKQTPAA